MGTTTNGSNLDRGHCSGNVEVSVGFGLHLDDAVAALDVLGGILARGDKNRSDNVGGVGVETSDRSGHCRSNKVLVDVEMDESLDGRFQDLCHDLVLDGRLGHDRLSASLKPVDGRWFLVCAKVAREREHRHVWKVLRKHLDGFLHSL